MQKAGIPDLDCGANNFLIANPSSSCNAVLKALGDAATPAPATPSPGTIAQAIAQLPTTTDIEKLIEVQVQKLTTQLEAAERENAALRLETAELAAKMAVPAAEKARLKALFARRAVFKTPESTDLSSVYYR